MPKTFSGKLDTHEVADLIGIPFEEWAHQCHGISLAIVKAGLVEGRVARGSCAGVIGQHSWIVVGDDCYDPKAQIIDPTLWSYADIIDGIWYGSMSDGLHSPHGAGNIWEYGQPSPPTGDVIELAVDPGTEARAFLDFAAPNGLDARGWMVIANAPQGGWPAHQIFEAMYDTERLSVMVPIDMIGMLTDRNPNGLYLNGPEKPPIWKA